MLTSANIGGSGAALDSPLKVRHIVPLPAAHSAKFIAVE
jgi:hypothetical protein